jgi:hypothetical protein
MSSLFDMEPAIAELRAIANLIRRLAVAVEGITFASDALRFVSDWLIDLANDLDLFAGDSLDQPIAEDGEHEAAITSDNTGPVPPGDSKQAGAPWHLLVSWAGDHQSRREGYTADWTVPPLSQVGIAYRSARAGSGYLSTGVITGHCFTADIWNPVSFVRLWLAVLPTLWAAPRLGRVGP